MSAYDVKEIAVALKKFRYEIRSGGRVIFPVPGVRFAEG